MGKNEKNLKKKSFGFRKKNFGSETDTEIVTWFRFPIPKPNFSQMLLYNHFDLNVDSAVCRYVGAKHQLKIVSKKWILISFRALFFPKDSAQWWNECSLKPFDGFIWWPFS